MRILVFDNMSSAFKEKKRFALPIRGLQKFIDDDLKVSRQAVGLRLLTVGQHSNGRLISCLSQTGKSLLTKQTNVIITNIAIINIYFW